jgi:hypothetical protein
VDRFVHSLHEGYDTVLEDEGSNVSAGEKQLLTIARAFLARPSVLILDEATSSVDTRTEVLVQKAMSALRSDRTSFVIAHRLSTIRDADLGDCQATVRRTPLNHRGSPSGLDVVQRHRGNRHAAGLWETCICGMPHLHESCSVVNPNSPGMGAYRLLAHYFQRTRQVDQG